MIDLRCSNRTGARWVPVVHLGSWLRVVHATETCHFFTSSKCPQLIAPQKVSSRLAETDRRDARGNSVNRPGFGNEQLFEESNRIAVGHSRDEVSRGHIDPLALDGPQIEKRLRLLADFFPEPREDG